MSAVTDGSYSMPSGKLLYYTLQIQQKMYVPAIFRTCAKWPQKPFPQDRQVFKLSSEELPILVSNNIVFSI